MNRIPLAARFYLLASTSCACLHSFLSYFRPRHVISPRGKYINYSYLPSTVLPLIVFKPGERVARPVADLSPRRETVVAEISLHPLREIRPQVDGKLYIIAISISRFLSRLPASTDKAAMCSR